MIQRALVGCRYFVEFGVGLLHKMTLNGDALVATAARKLSKDGVDAGKLKYPQGVAVLGGTVYVCESDNARICMCAHERIHALGYAFVHTNSHARHT